MTPTNYSEVLKDKAALVLRPLADAVQARERELAAIRKRLADETERAVGAESDLAVLKGDAALHLAVGAFERFKTSLKKRQAILDASRETARLLADEITPQAERAFVVARRALQVGFLNFVVTSRPLCEVPMADLIGQALLERDAFMAALDLLAATYGATFTGSCRSYPDPAHLRSDPSPGRSGMAISTGLDERLVDASTISARRGDTLLEGPRPPAGPPPPPAAPDMPQEAPGVRGASDMTQEPSGDSRALEVAPNGPSASAGDVLVDAPDVEVRNPTRAIFDAAKALADRVRTEKRDLTEEEIGLVRGLWNAHPSAQSLIPSDWFDTVKTLADLEHVIGLDRDGSDPF